MNYNLFSLFKWPVTDMAAKRPIPIQLPRSRDIPSPLAWEMRKNDSRRAVFQPLKYEYIHLQDSKCRNISIPNSLKQVSSSKT